MNQDKQASNPTAYEDEISLVDIYLAVKRNSTLFFTIVVLSFLMSILVTYLKYQSNVSKETLSDSPNFVTEYVLWIEIGKIYNINTDKNWIDNPNNTLAKINNIYIPKVAAEFMNTNGSKLNQSLISVINPPNTQLIVIKVIKSSDNIDYNKVLMSLASYIFVDHNKGLGLNNKNAISIKPSRIIEGPTKVIVKSKSKSKSKVLIPVLGLILGLFLGFVAVFIREFLKKVKEAEISQ